MHITRAGFQEYLCKEKRFLSYFKKDRRNIDDEVNPSILTISNVLYVYKKGDRAGGRDAKLFIKISVYTLFWLHFFIWRLTTV